MTHPQPEMTLEISIVARKNGRAYSQLRPGGLAIQNDSPPLVQGIYCHQDLRYTVMLAAVSVATCLAAAETDNDPIEFPKRLAEISADVRATESKPDIS